MAEDVWDEERDAQMVLLGRVLPSREMAERARVDGYAGLVVWKLIRAYVSGRLVDREAIDYEAGLAVARELWTVEPVWDESSFALMLNAALGEV